ncbi:MAG: hypothetical protein LBV18_01680 [Alistipes sp.]|jgi:hypothetical protein|nr:hypothetical protein [Alistipes sp.]
MKYISIFLLAVTFSVSCATQTKTWTKANYRNHIANREDPAVWDMQMLEVDVRDMPLMYDPELPMNGVFPEPLYSVQMENTWTATGNDGGEVRIEERKIFYEFFYTGRNVNNTRYIGEAEDEVFFLILVLTDTDENEYISDISSRNNPDVMGQGRFNLKNSEVDYIAFLTADRNNYAIVNGRLFDLRFGRIVLIAPQKDGSFRSMQLSSPIMSSDDVEGCVESLVGKRKPQKFFLAPGNIE